MRVDEHLGVLFYTPKSRQGFTFAEAEFDPLAQALKRRSQRDKTTWARCAKIADEWLPKPKILHPWPSDRFAVKHPRWEPYAGKPHVRFCAGALSNGRPYRDRLCARWLSDTIHIRSIYDLSG